MLSVDYVLLQQLYTQSFVAFVSGTGTILIREQGL